MLNILYDMNEKLKRIKSLKKSIRTFGAKNFNQ